ncbi:transposase [Bdellovibrio sp. KM01]|uniref:transposase n=1 Tax=Bdellovibrio sp. KM01 TaxID=2748865 RepID=UPI0021025E52|nr:transposase [Bdellovibrio sp. KM01]
MHVVLFSHQAKGTWSFRNHKNWKRISEILTLQARRYGVQLREVVNGGDHLQLVLKLKNRELFSSFIRAISGIIAMVVTGAAKTRALKDKFWDFRPWSRVVALIPKYSVRADQAVQKYLVEAKIFNFKEAPA